MIAFSMFKEVGAAMLPFNLKMVFGYSYEFLMGMPNWIGYAIAALYFMALEYDVGDYMCEGFGYGYYIIDALSVFTEFSKQSDKAKQASQGTGMD